MMRLFDWIKTRFFPDESPPERPLWQTGAHVVPRPKKKAPPSPAKVGFAPDVVGRIADGGPGKNVLIRNKYVREDTGTHETLKIVDDSLLESDEELGADPYSTGRFDRSRSWDSSRKRN
jgi:hypothetical protein